MPGEAAAPNTGCRAPPLLAAALKPPQVTEPVPVTVLLAPAAPIVFMIISASSSQKIAVQLAVMASAALPARIGAPVVLAAPPEIVQV